MRQPRPPFPLIELRIEPKLKADAQKLLSLLDELSRTEPGFSYTVGPESDDILLGGVDELKLVHIISVLKVNGVDVAVGAPEVCYRETITRAVTKDYTHKKQTGGEGQFARVIFQISPNDRDAGFVFENKAPESSLPVSLVAGAENGMRTVLSSGPLIGAPVVDVRVTLLDGAYHEIDSSFIAFEIAARQAFRDGIEGASPVLLEPIVKASVETPEEYVGNVIGDLHSRRGKVVETSQADTLCKIDALVPLSNMFGYINNLRQLTSGRGKYSIAYSHYASFKGPDDDPNLFPPAVGMRA